MVVGEGSSRLRNSTIKQQLRTSPLTSRVFRYTHKSNPCLCSVVPKSLPPHSQIHRHFGSLTPTGQLFGIPSLLMIWLGKMPTAHLRAPSTCGFPTATPIPSRAPDSPTPAALDLEDFSDEHQDSAEFQLARTLPQSNDPTNPGFPDLNLHCAAGTWQFRHSVLFPLLPSFRAPNWSPHSRL
jgi:hypothetical protein